MSQEQEAVRRSLSETLRDRRGTGGQLLNPSDIARFEATIAAVPPTARRVLDAGCGLGVLTDVLEARGFEAVGIDLDPAAMVYMRAPHLVGSLANLPFDDRAFDVVVANEVLEHLPEPVFSAARGELARVANRYIVMTVPNAESLEAASTRCPACRCVYSLHGHVRRFDRQDFGDLFHEFHLQSAREVGPFKVRHRSIEWLVRRRLLGRWPAGPGLKCPQCEHVQPGELTSTELGASGSPLSRAVRLVLGAPWRRWWLLAVFERNG